jgi:hypothetical protein
MIKQIIIMYPVFVKMQEINGKKRQRDKIGEGIRVMVAGFSLLKKGDIQALFCRKKGKK